MPPIPFLPPDQQEDYLRSHEMIEGPALSQEESDWLGTVNFHYFLGYARNYRALIGRKEIPGPKSFSDIRSVVTAEADLSAFLTPWLRKAEWFLRALAVKHYCQGKGHGNGFLEMDEWRSFEPGDCERLQRKMLDSILRHGEPYVSKEVDRRAGELGVTRLKKYERAKHEDCLKLVDGLPLWSVVDSFSIGMLGTFIMRCDSNPHSGTPVWKKIAQELGITANHFDITLQALGSIRNLVFHHQRLWMRPVAKSPGLPKDLNRKYREYNFKSKNNQAQFIGLLTISRFLPAADRDTYRDGLEDIVQRDDLFALGIMRPPFAQQK